ncbi:MAG: lipopolysaccharide heptosyltransferase II [Methylococcaceae bacterium]
MCKYPKILIIAPSWVGDMIMAQSLFIALKKNSPDCQIEVLAPTWTLALLARMPQVSKAIALNLTHGQFGFNERKQLGKQLRAENYNQAIVLPNSWKSALIPFFANIPLRTGYIGECRFGLLNDARRLNKAVLKMTVQRFVALASNHQNLPPDCPNPQLIVNEEKQQAVINQFQLNTNTKILALCAGAEYGLAKRWPVNYFAQVANYYLQQGGQVWLFGSEKDKVITDAINNLTQGQCQNFAGQTNLAQAVDLMSLVDTVISNDSGLMHLASSLDKKVIAIYGSSDPQFTPPLSNKAQIVSLNLDCSPCFKRECPLEHTNCLTQLLPERLIELL